MFGNNGPFSYSPRGFSPDDLPHQRRAFQSDDLKGAPLQGNNMSRPSGKSIYMQRKEYSESLSKQPESFHIRVEHLLTCELDGQEMKTVDDCLAKLKRLDAKGRLWPQEMIMEVQGGYLLLSDIEAKTELESLPLSSIMQTKAVLDSCAYNSVLAITVLERSKHITQVFMFQCEETGAELIKGDLDKVVERRGGGDVEPRRDQSDIRSHLENIIGQHTPGNPWQAMPRTVQGEMTPPPPVHPLPHLDNRGPESVPPLQGYTRQEGMLHHPDPHELQGTPEVPPEQTDAERNTEILNHIINDLEIFMGKVSAAANEPSLQNKKSKKKNGVKKKKSKKYVDRLPPLEEYISCLGKIKYGFNLLGQLEGTLVSPSAADFVHIFFDCLGTLVPQYPADLPSSVLTPLLTEAALQHLSHVVSPQEENLWRSLGDSWNVPRSGWLDGDFPTYIPEFYDGWQLPPRSRIPTGLPHQNGGLSRSSSRRFPPVQPNGQMTESQGFSSRAMQWHPEEYDDRSSFDTPPPTRSNEPPQYMQVIYDFRARNNQELSVLKGEMVEVIQKAKQWWLIRNGRNEEGNVPQNVLEPVRSARPMENPPETQRPVTLDMSSSPAEVKAWLQYRGFSKITVTSLGVLTGKLLLGMTKDEIRTVCPEEGGKVFFQLQAVKSAIALASEPSGLYNGRY